MSGVLWQGCARMASAVQQGVCGAVFSVDWIHRETLSFQKTQHISNLWNDNMKVQVSRDGQVTCIDCHDLDFDDLKVDFSTEGGNASWFL